MQISVTNIQQQKITYLNEFPYAIEKNHKTRTKNYLHADFCKFSHLYYVMTSGQPLTHIFHILRSISDDNARWAQLSTRSANLYAHTYIQRHTHVHTCVLFRLCGIKNQSNFVDSSKSHQLEIWKTHTKQQHTNTWKYNKLCSACTHIRINTW